jgi:hypothetical protein
MKKIWKNNSYAIILIAAGLIFSLAIKVNDIASSDEYITVTIEEGQSLWVLAHDYASEHNLTESQFISWVEKENGIEGEVIYPGDEILIPVSADQTEPAQIAGAER